MIFTLFSHANFKVYNKLIETKHTKYFNKNLYIYYNKLNYIKNNYFKLVVFKVY